MFKYRNLEFANTGITTAHYIATSFLQQMLLTGLKLVV
jgi:hypothetical protein